MVFLALLPVSLVYLTFPPLTHFVNDIMLSAIGPVTYFHRRREKECSTERQKAKERKRRGRWDSIQPAINSAAGGGEVLKMGAGRIVKDGREDEAGG